jgi:hypothetical protein
MACASEDYRVEVSHGNAMTPQEYGKEGSPGKSAGTLNSHNTNSSGKGSSTSIRGKILASRPFTLVHSDRTRDSRFANWANDFYWCPALNQTRACPLKLTSEIGRQSPNLPDPFSSPSHRPEPSRPCHRVPTPSSGGPRALAQP